VTFDPLHGHDALRRGRWSESGGEYFLTFCTASRRQGLTAPNLVKAIWGVADKMNQESTWILRTGVVMPDHIHLLAEINSAIGLADAVRQFKGRLTPFLRNVRLQWQPAFFDHRMRPGEDRLPIFMYIFLNPYRAKLLAPDQMWPGYHCANEEWSWFEQQTNHSCAYPEWLA
jgi:REP element-mobilizing transposase RayT